MGHGPPQKNGKTSPPNAAERLLLKKVEQLGKPRYWEKYQKR